MSDKPTDQAPFVEPSDKIRALFDRALAGRADADEIDSLRGLLGGRNVGIQDSADGAVIVTGDRNIVIAGAVASAVRAVLVRLYPSALYQLPPPTRTFVGREHELKELLDGINKGGVTVSGLRGMGGVGKTELALVVADNLKERFPDAQIRLNMQGTSRAPLSPEDALSRVIQAFHPDARIPESMAELRPLYISVLTGKKALILADNAAEPAQVKPLIPPTGCCLLVTSRFRFTLKDWVSVDVSALLPSEAKKLLCNLSPRLTEVEAEELAKVCGYLPLALCLASGALRVRTELSAQNYLHRLRQTGARIVQLDKYKDWTDEERGIENSLALSYDLLTPELQKFWRFLAVFPANFSVKAAAAVTRAEENFAAERLGDLWLRGMAERDDVEQERYRLHDLSREFAASKLSINECHSASRRNALYFVSLLSQTEALYLSGGKNVIEGLTIFDRERTNVEAGQKWSAEHAAEEKIASHLTNAYSSVGTHVLSLRLYPKVRIRWLQSALASARQLKDCRAEGVHLFSLGNALTDLGQFRKAIEHYEQALGIAQEFGDRGGEATTLGNLGIVYKNLGDPRKAIEHAEQALTIARGLGSRRSEGHYLSNLGGAHLFLGDIKKAIEHCEQALLIARELGDRRGEEFELGNLGGAYLTLNEPRKAIEYCEQALVIARELGDRRGEGASLGNLGIAYKDLGDPRRAIAYYEQCLVIHRESGDQRGIENVFGNIGNAYADLGEIRKAIEYHTQQLTLARQDEAPRGEATALANLGVAYVDIGESQKAIEHSEQALAAFRKIGDRCGEESALYHLGLVYSDLREPRRAVDYYEKALVIARTLADPRREATVLRDLGTAYLLLGEHRESIECYKRVLVIVGNLGDRKVEGAVLDDLGNAYADLGEPRKATEHYKKALGVYQEFSDRSGEAHELGNLGSAHLLLGETREAIERCEQALGIYREIGDKGGEGSVLNTSGNAYGDLRDFQRAIEQYEQALIIHREIGNRQGEGNVLGNLGVTYKDCGDFLKAIDYYEQALVIARDIGDHRCESNALGNLSYTYKNILDEPQKAINYYEQELALARGIGDRQGEGNALWNISLTRKDLNEDALSISLAETALQIFREIEDANVAIVEQQLATWRGKTK